MNKALILLTVLITSIAQCTQNSCVELDADVEFGKNLISFDGKQATLEDLINNNAEFGKVELWYENRDMKYLGTIESPKLTSLSNATAHFHTLKKQQPAKPRIVWSENQKALILLEGWNSGYACDACEKLAAHKAIVAQFEKKYETIEREFEKNLP